MKSLLLRAQLVVPVVVLGSIGLSQCPAPTWSVMNQQFLTGAKASIVWDFDGAGPGQPVLVIGGTSYANSASAPPNNLVTWDGTQLQAMTGVIGIQPSFDAFVDFNGTLVAACNFYATGGVSANSGLKLTGSAWQPPGSTFNGFTHALAVST